MVIFLFALVLFLSDVLPVTSARTHLTRPGKKSRHKRHSTAGSSALEADALTTRPTRWFCGEEKHDPYAAGVCG